ncbi:MAG TPA: hypothetical protein VL463_29285 [Kofleriaceae bacterium]|nr:hypothetical protein [Kofleriaceae bacterium]
MSAAADPQPGFDDPMGQVASDVDALRRRMDDQQATLRRNHQALTALAESVGKVVEQSRKRDRRASMNSFVAYILFTLLVGGGAVLLYRSRAAELERGRNDAVADLEAARKALGDAQKQLHDRDVASARAFELYRAQQSGKHDGVSFDEIAKLSISPTERDVLANGEQQVKAKQLEAMTDVGVELVKKGDFARAVVELRRAGAAGASSAAQHYWLGVAMIRGEDKDVATADGELRAAIAAKIDQPDVRFWLGQALEREGKYADARKQYETFAAAYPMAPLAAQARARWIALGQPAAQ